MKKFWLKTLGWAVISGCLVFVSAVLSGSQVEPALLATALVVASKTPVYAGYEWLCDRIAGKHAPLKPPVASVRQFPVMTPATPPSETQAWYQEQYLAFDEE